MRRFRIVVTGLSLALLLAGCQTFEGLKKDLGDVGKSMSSSSSSSSSSLFSSGPSSEDFVSSGRCPQAEIVHDLGMLTEFTDPANPQETTLVSHATLTRVETACSFNEQSMIVDLKMTFEAMLGQQGRARAADKPAFSYPYFVAVVSPGGDILAKEVFSAAIAFDVGSDRQVYHEELRQIIPVRNKDDSGRFKIMTGFQLGADQLEYNRLVIKRQQEEAAAAAAAARAAPAQPVEIVPATLPGGDGLQITRMPGDEGPPVVIVPPPGQP
jgi:predicted small secreted protein